MKFLMPTIGCCVLAALPALAGAQYKPMWQPKIKDMSLTCQSFKASEAEVRQQYSGEGELTEQTGKCGSFLLAVDKGTVRFFNGKKINPQSFLFHSREQCICHINSD